MGFAVMQRIVGFPIVLLAPAFWRG